jgi:hypothetical protein
MIFVKNYSKKEILKIVAEKAAESIPDERKGVIDARYNSNNDIEVYFIEDLFDQQVS